MTAAEVLADSARRGVRLSRAGDSLRFEGQPAVLTMGFLAELKANKPAVLDLLRRDRTARAVAALSADRREQWEERAAIREFDGGLPRPQAEALALIDVGA